MAARRRYWQYLEDSAGARQDFPWIDPETWTAAKKRIYPGGRLPASARFGPAAPSQWLSNEDLPWLAQMLQAIICVCDMKNAVGWATYLPLKVLKDTRLAVVGLVFEEGHWQRCTFKKRAPLPPVVACSRSWSHFPRSLLLEERHRRLHRVFVFMVRSLGKRIAAALESEGHHLRLRHGQSRRMGHLPAFEGSKGHSPSSNWSGLSRRTQAMLYVQEAPDKA